MKAAARRKDWDCLVVDDLSRLGRHTIEALQTFEELSLLGVGIIAVADGIDTTNGKGKLPYYMKSMINEFFLDDLRERVSRGLKGQVVRGYSAGGRVFGYKYTEIPDPNPSKKAQFGKSPRIGVQIEIDPDQEKTVKLIFDLSANDRMRVSFFAKSFAQKIEEHQTPPR